MFEKISTTYPNFFTCKNNFELLGFRAILRKMIVAFIGNNLLTEIVPLNKWKILAGILLEK